jgi:hypothetical protein
MVTACGVEGDSSQTNPSNVVTVDQVVQLGEDRPLTAAEQAEIDSQIATMNPQEDNIIDPTTLPPSSPLLVEQDESIDPSTLAPSSPLLATTQNDVSGLAVSNVRGLSLTHDGITCTSQVSASLWTITGSSVNLKLTNPHCTTSTATNYSDRYLGNSGHGWVIPVKSTRSDWHNRWFSTPLNPAVNHSASIRLCVEGPNPLIDLPYCQTYNFAIVHSNNSKGYSYKAKSNCACNDGSRWLLSAVQLGAKHTAGPCVNVELNSAHACNGFCLNHHRGGGVGSIRGAVACTAVLHWSCTVTCRAGTRVTIGMGQASTQEEACTTAEIDVVRPHGAVCGPCVCEDENDPPEPE